VSRASSRERTTAEACSSISALSSFSPITRAAAIKSSRARFRSGVLMRRGYVGFQCEAIRRLVGKVYSHHLARFPVSLGPGTFNAGNGLWLARLNYRQSIALRVRTFDRGIDHYGLADKSAWPRLLGS